MKLSRRKLFAGAAALAAAAGLGAATRWATAGYYQGPITDHFDGTHFVGPHAVSSKGLAFWRWQLSRNAAEWPAHVVNDAADIPPARVNGNALRISFVGHASFLIQTAGLNILTDPVWSERASPFTFVGPKRVREPGIAFDALPPISAILVSHNHYDHLDVATLSRLAARDRPRVITPLGNDTIMHEYDAGIAAEARDWGESVALAPEVAVTLAPARHWSARNLWDRNKALWSAFVIDTPAGRIYFVGDTGYDGDLFRDTRARHGPIRVAILPIGAYEPRWFMHDLHMNPEEAVRVRRDLGAELAIGSHFGTFRLTEEAIDAPLQALAAARVAVGLPEDRFRTLTPGQYLTV
jgi:L-ascorbate metabolism protein UlaG (beta-lactamase superfamily)